jgi:mannose-6-phosphate isomerase-like protein (cupin superfamily)
MTRPRSLVDELDLPSSTRSAVLYVAFIAAGLANARCAGSIVVASAHHPGEERHEPRRVGPFASAVITADQGVVERLPTGALNRYQDGATTPSLRDLMTAVATMKPGEQLHPPHVHAEEELLWIAKGEGVWSLAGKEFPAKAGDLLYVEPWVEHGLRNSGTTPLEFFVVKWNPASGPPADPSAKQ